jgi:hypothetical protein
MLKVQLSMFWNLAVRRVGRYWKLAFGFSVALLLGACATPVFPPVDLASAGWRTRVGQAIWKPDRSKPEIVGDLLIATDQNGNAYLEFSKTFPIVSARLTTNAWQVEFPPQRRHYAAQGNPPARIGWLQLLRAADERSVGPPWEVSGKSEKSITLANATTGERIEAHF